MTTGLYNSADGRGRLYISSDRGTTWQQKVDLPFSVGANNQGRAIGERLMVDPNQPSTLFYGSRTAGLWKSTDAGSTWTQVTSLSATRMSADQISAAGGSAMGVELVVYDTGTKGTGTATQTIYTAIAPDYASVAGMAFNLYKSTDGGATWSGVSTPVAGYHIPHMVRGVDGMFYVVFTLGSGPGANGPAALYKFDGTTWTLLKQTTPTQWTVIAGLTANGFRSTSMSVNPNAEGDVWLADGHSLYHSVDSGATWKKLTVTQSIWGSQSPGTWPDVYGASGISLGKAAAGSSYTAAVYIVGVINGVWGVYRSDDAGVTWVRINDDQHQYGGIGPLAADQNVHGRVFIAGSGRGVFYNH